MGTKSYLPWFCLATMVLDTADPAQLPGKVLLAGSVAFLGGLEALYWLAAWSPWGTPPRSSHPLGARTEALTARGRGFWIQMLARMNQSCARGSMSAVLILITGVLLIPLVANVAYLFALVFAVLVLALVAFLRLVPGAALAVLSGPGLLLFGSGWDRLRALEGLLWSGLVTATWYVLMYGNGGSLSCSGYFRELLRLGTNPTLVIQSFALSGALLQADQTLRRA